MRRCSFVFVALFACSNLPASDDPFAAPGTMGSGSDTGSGSNTGSAVPESCKGTALSCFSQFDCAEGCAFASGCVGLAHLSCTENLADQTTCVTNTNCEVGPDGGCIAINDAECTALTDVTSCQNDSNCVWESSCTGTAPTCSQAPDQAVCSELAGCSWSH
jgi:hypothetical protein